jgi:uncharacterized membrane protein
MVGATMKRRISAMVLGVAMAAMPLVAAAQESESTFEAASRAASPTADWGTVMLVTALSLVALVLVTSLGYLYRRERGLDWAFQKPDAPHDDHH